MPTASARIIGTGSALPARCVTNAELVDELAKRGVETSDAWIVERTGIRQRHLSEPGMTTRELAAMAARSALGAAGVTADSIDLIVLATTTADQIFPSTACLVQAELGCTNAAAFDVQAVCSGFIYALTTAEALIRSGVHKRALVIGAETFSRIIDWNDRATCVLFGDGAGAVVLEASTEPGILARCLHADGSRADILCAAGRLEQGGVHGHPFLHMDGRAVFKMAVEVLESSAHEVLAAAGLQAKELDWLIPHQANIRILTATARKLGVPSERLVLTVGRHGNTSAASVPLALDWAVREGAIRTGHTVLLQGVGGGLTWGSVLVRM